LVGTSNRSGDIDPCLRRGGRLEHEIAVLNTQQDRGTLLQGLLAKVFGEDSGGAIFLWPEDLAALSDKMAMQTGGYVAADLAALVRAMHTLALTELSSPARTSVAAMLKLFHVAAKSVLPSCLRGATISLPNLTFDDVIGYEEVKSSLQRVLCFAKPEQQALSSRFGLHTSPGGVLLHGPPGNSKTRLASAAAAHHGLPMISLSAADIYSPYVGDAEAEVRRAFQLARQAAPCVLFIDELDSIVTNRSNDSGGGSTSATVEGRVLATLLTEMDGIQSSNDSEFSSAGGKSQNSSGGVIVLGATNRLDFIDAALLRKVTIPTYFRFLKCPVFLHLHFVTPFQGRFHHVLLVPLPNASERRQLLHYFARKCNLLQVDSGEVCPALSARLREGMSGAEIENLCREATLEKHRSQMQ
jgi:transitional endoplasmic reticulum ATPase